MAEDVEEDSAGVEEGFENVAGGYERAEEDELECFAAAAMNQLKRW